MHRKLRFSFLVVFIYNAFGNIVEQSGSFGNPYRYAGYQYDTESRLYNLNARFYDAKLARFMQDDQKVILSNLQKLTDHALMLNDAGYVDFSKYEKDKNSINYKDGNRLLERMVASKLTARILVNNDGENGTNPDLNGRSDGKRQSAIIKVDPKKDMRYLIADSETAVVSREPDPSPFYITLVHELIHADRYIRAAHEETALSNDSSVTVYNDEYYYYLVGFSNGKAVRESRKDHVEELMTVGLSKKNLAGDITENSIRAEHGLPLRRRYN